MFSYLILTTLCFLTATVFSVIGAFISFITIYRHLQFYSVPQLQRSVIRILLIIPIYALLTVWGLCIPSETFNFFLSVPRELWEAVVVYCFLSLILLSCGGENLCAQYIQQDPGHIDTPWQCNFSPTWMPLIFRSRIPLSPAFVRECKRATLQFVALKPLAAIITLVVLITGNSWILTSSTWKILHGIAYNVSYCVALHALSLFYLATRNCPGLKGTRPLRKFAAVKVIVFATFWQGCLLRVLLLWNDFSVHRVNQFLLCIELPFIALLQAWAFPVEEYLYYRKQPTAKVDLEQAAEGAAVVTEAVSARGAFVFAEAIVEPVGLGREMEPSELGSPTEVRELDSGFEERELGQPPAGPPPAGPTPAGPTPAGQPGSLPPPPPPPPPPTSAIASAMWSAVTRAASSEAPLTHIQTEIQSLQQSKGFQIALKNARDVLSVDDVMEDAFINFNHRYAHHSLLESTTTSSPVKDAH